MARYRDFGCFGRCDLSHRLRQAKKSRSGINPGLDFVCRCNGGITMRHLTRSKGPLTGTRVLMMTSALALMAASTAITAPAFADEAAAKKWIDSEFQPSTLSKDDQMKEMQWFMKAAEPYKGMEINVTSETLTVHEYESKTLAKA